MTDYNDLITRLRSMDGIGDIQLNELTNRKTPMAAADAIAELVSRVSMLESARIAYASEFPPDAEGLPDTGRIHANICAMKVRVAELKSRLEISPLHNVDGIMARDATIKLQDGRIAELEANRADLAKQALVAWDSGEEWEPLAFCLCAEENGLDSCHELIWEGYPPEPWGERWQKYEREAKRMIDLVSQYAAPPVITQHEPVTTVDDRHNADGKSCHITDDLPAGMPLYAAQPVAAPVRLTDEQAEKVDEAIREALGDAYDCLRVWNAWSYGTMGPDDFSQVAEDPDRVAEIRNAAAVALGFKLDGEQ